jgi:hypothetical protein
VNDRCGLNGIFWVLRSGTVADASDQRLPEVAGECVAALGSHRECLGLVVDTSLTGQRVARELDRIAELRGYPGMIVSDNGTELTSNGARQRPILDRLWRRQGSQEIAEIVGERMKLEPTALAANVRHDSRGHLIAPLPSLIHCSHVPRLL